ncbi:MAG: winged helix-turn-helix transcriptional regulator [Planctomycetota bacterium]
MSRPSNPPAAVEPSPAAAALAELFHHRWAVPTLAALSSGAVAGRFAPLMRRLGVARASLRRTLDSLEAQGLARPNPGYGHPLRPEIVLTPRGKALGPWCEGFVAAAERAQVTDVAARKWSMPTLLAVHAGCDRFSTIQAALEGVTARALTLALKELAEAGLLERVVYDDFPPSVRYRAAGAGRRLARVLAELPDDG